MLDNFIDKTKKWGINESFVEAIILVGSYARGTQNDDSDIDLVILTSNKQHYIENPQIFSAFGLIDKSNIEFYGECTSIRIWYTNGLEVEFGMVSLKWIDLPLDFGTERALSDGYKILVDKRRMFLPIKSIVPEHSSCIANLRMATATNPYMCRNPLSKLMFYIYYSFNFNDFYPLVDSVWTHL